MNETINDLFKMQSSGDMILWFSSNKFRVLKQEFLSRLVLNHEKIIFTRAFKLKSSLFGPIIRQDVKSFKTRCKFNCVLEFMKLISFLLFRCS